MIRTVFAHYHLPMLACVGLLLFVSVFAGATVWVFRQGSREFYQDLSSRPLRD